MSKVILTMDDIPAGNTKTIIDYFTEKKLPAVMFVVGEQAVEDMDTLVYAINHGIILGNHTYTHPFFSEISYEECVEEIEKTEEVLTKAYEMAGTERPVKLFRFPYIDKGGEKYDIIQAYLKEHGFKRIDDSGVLAEGYKKAGHNRGCDTACSFDCQEYNISSGQITFEEVMRRIAEGDEGGTNMTTDPGVNIMLIHSHDHTEAAVPEYYRIMIDSMLDKGVEFIKPEFI